MLRPSILIWQHPGRALPWALHINVTTSFQVSKHADSCSHKRCSLKPCPKYNYRTQKELFRGFATHVISRGTWRWPLTKNLELKVTVAPTIPNQEEQSFPWHFRFHSLPPPISGNPKVLNTKTKRTATQLFQLVEKYDRDFQISLSPQ